MAAAAAELRISTGGAFSVGASAEYLIRNKNFAGGAFPAGASLENKKAKYKLLLVWFLIYLLIIKFLKIYSVAR